MTGGKVGVDNIDRQPRDVRQRNAVMKCKQNVQSIFVYAVAIRDFPPVEKRVSAGTELRAELLK